MAKELAFTDGPPKKDSERNGRISGVYESKGLIRSRTWVLSCGAPTLKEGLSVPSENGFFFLICLDPDGVWCSKD
ncbi:MAG TPA: hypothetical protein DCP92_22135 [Nitrospiraceae bacterium]|jgi:hypothetical protein|nr:hypothetical protein [Nitrospiraceae bacterium]